MKLIDHRFTSKKEKKKLSKTHYNKTAKIKAKAKKIVIYKGVPKNYQCISQQKFENRYTCVPHPDPSSLLPPSTIPLGHPSAPAPNIQYHASNLDWRLISYMILYTFQCHSPKSSHPLITLF